MTLTKTKNKIQQKGDVEQFHLKKMMTVTSCIVLLLLHSVLQSGACCCYCMLLLLHVTTYCNHCTLHVITHFHYYKLSLLHACSSSLGSCTLWSTHKESNLDLHKLLKYCNLKS